jgi:hypothetical protein
MTIPTTPLMGNGDEGVIDRGVVDRLVVVRRTSIVFWVVDLGRVKEMVRIVGT